MARYKSNPNFPVVKNWGGVRSINKNLERSATLVGNREEVARTLLCMCSTTITDILTWDEKGNVKVKAANQIPANSLHVIKKISCRVDRAGNSFLDVELYDKVSVLRLLAKASGLLDNPDDGSDRPSVIDVNVVAPTTGK